MSPQKFKFVLDNLVADKRFYRLMFILSVVTCLVMGIAVHRLIGVERTIIVPPEINKSFWVDGEKVSREYLEEMALHVTQLELSVTPESFRYQTERLLKYAHPSVNGEMRASMDAHEMSMRRDQISSWFAPTEAAADERKMSVKVTGMLTSYVGKNALPSVSKSYLVEFVYTNSKLYLKTFSEVVDEKANKTAAGSAAGNG